MTGTHTISREIVPLRSLVPLCPTTVSAPSTTCALPPCRAPAEIPVTAGSAAPEGGSGEFERTQGVSLSQLVLPPCHMSVQGDGL